jgi:membrane fusion protein (multidrug efflux system)
MLSSMRPLFAFLLAISVFCGACRRADSKQAGPGPAQQRQPVEVAPLARQDLQETLSVVGSIAANESASIRPEIAGSVRAVLFEEGQAVKAGQVLVKIDDAELQAQYAQTEARFKLAELNLARNQSLAESRMVSQADFDRANAEFAASSAELSLLRVRLDRSEVKAPFDGVAGSRSISPGDYVTTQSVITVVHDMSRLKIEFQVPERFLAKVRNGTRFAVSSKGIAAGRAVEGEVYFVSSVIERGTRSSEVKGLLAEPPPELKPGMFANIELVLDVRQGGFAVPEGAILNTPSGPQLIFVKDDGGEPVADFVPVQLGLRARGVVEVMPVKEAFTEGRRVVAAGVGALVLFPGAKLEPRPLRREFQPGGGA